MADSLFTELKRRNVVKVAVAYIIVSWLILQVISSIVPIIEAPDWISKAVLIFLIAGFPIALIFAWAFELTPEGIKKDSEISNNDTNSKQSTKLFYSLIGSVTFLALAFILYQEFVESPEQQPILTSNPETNTTAVKTPSNNNTSASEAETATLKSTNKKAIAVLPFVNMSSDSSQEYFSDGMTEEILNVLAKNKKLLVAARTSAFFYKGKNEDIRTIGKALGVAYVLEGSVRRAEDELRITAQLIRVKDGFHLWSETYDRKMEKVFALQEEIAKDISKALQAPLGIEVKHLVDNKTTNMEAYDLYLRGRQLIRQRGKSIGEAANLMTLAIEKDEQYAPAWALRSIALMYIPGYMSSYNGQPINYDELMVQVGISARKAVSLDPNLAIAHYALATFYQQHLQWAMAEDQYLLAIKLDPINIDIIEDYSQFLQIVGRLKESYQLAKKGIVLEPNTPVAILNYIDKLIYNYTSPNQAAIEPLLNKVEKLEPYNPWLINVVVYNYIQQNQYQKAYDYNEKCEDCIGTQGYEATQYYLKNVIEGTQPNLLKYPLADTFSPVLIHAVGGVELVLDTLEQFYSSDTFSSAQAPFMSEVRKTKRYKTLVKFLGLADYWQHRGWPDFCHPISDTDFVCE